MFASTMQNHVQFAIYRTRARRSFKSGASCEVPILNMTNVICRIICTMRTVLKVCAGLSANKILAMDIGRSLNLLFERIPFEYM